MTDQVVIPRPRGRGARLGNLKQVRSEMVKVYREVRSGQIEPADGTKLTYMLKQIFDAIQIEQLETRLEALEKQAAEPSVPDSAKPPLRLLPPRRENETKPAKQAAVESLVHGDG